MHIKVDGTRIGNNSQIKIFAVRKRLTNIELNRVELVCVKFF